MQLKVPFSFTLILVMLDDAKCGYEDDLPFDENGLSLKEVTKVIEYECEASEPFDKEKGMKFEPNTGVDLCTLSSMKLGRDRKTQFSITFAGYKVYLGDTSPVYNMLRCPAKWGDFHIKRVATWKYIIYFGPTEAEGTASYQLDEGTPSSEYEKQTGTQQDDSISTIYL